MLFLLGRKFRFIRYIYFKLTGRWLWGIVPCIRDYGSSKEAIYNYITDDEAAKWIADNIERDI